MLFERSNTFICVRICKQSCCAPNRRSPTRHNAANSTVPHIVLRRLCNKPRIFSIQDARVRDGNDFMKPHSCSTAYKHNSNNTLKSPFLTNGWFIFNTQQESNSPVVAQQQPTPSPNNTFLSLRQSRATSLTSCIMFHVPNRTSNSQASCCILCAFTVSLYPRRVIRSQQ